MSRGGDTKVFRDDFGSDLESGEEIDDADDTDNGRAGPTSSSSLLSSSSRQPAPAMVVPKPLQAAVSEFDQQMEAARRGRRASSDIWGSLLREDELVSGLSGSAINRKRKQVDRGVESYSLPPSKIAKTSRVFAHRRCQPVEKRIHVQEFTYDKSKARDHYGVDFQSDVADVARSIIKHLEEKNERIVEDVVEGVGQQKALELFYQTEDIRETGGLWTMNGERRRSPGGIFLYLMRADPEVSQELKDRLFKPQLNDYLNHQRERRRESRQKRKERRRMEKDSKQQPTFDSLLSKTTSQMLSAQPSTGLSVANDCPLDGSPMHKCGVTPACSPHQSETTSSNDDLSGAISPVSATEPVAIVSHNDQSMYDEDPPGSEGSDGSADWHEQVKPNEEAELFD